MSVHLEKPVYILGQSAQAELRLELLNEVSSSKFIEALGVIPKRHVRILNLGCGSGHLEERLSGLFTVSHFMGIDISAMRIQEARARTGALKSNNTFTFIQADLTSFSIKELEPCEILISRFVLSHLPNPLQQLERFLPLVRPGGFLCFEEVASDGSEYYCNTMNVGYRTFVKMVGIQIQAQNSSFDTGFQLLSELTKRPGKVIHSHLAQAILNTPRHKSILRLGVEDAKAGLLKQEDEKSAEEMITSLKEFEEDGYAYGLYTRSLVVIAQTP